MKKIYRAMAGIILALLLAIGLASLFTTGVGCDGKDEHMVLPRAEIVDRFKAAPDEAPVVPLAVDGKARRAVGHAVFSRQLAGVLSGVPAVAAISKIRKAERFVRFECSADERLVGRVLVARERVFPVAAVERHMNMTVYCHENPSRPPASADGFIIPTCAEKCKPGA